MAPGRRVEAGKEAVLVAKTCEADWLEDEGSKDSVTVSTDADTAAAAIDVAAVTLDCGRTGMLGGGSLSLVSRSYIWGVGEAKHAASSHNAQPHASMGCTRKPFPTPCIRESNSDIHQKLPSLASENGGCSMR